MERDMYLVSEIARLRNQELQAEAAHERLLRRARQEHTESGIASLVRR